VYVSEPSLLHFWAQGSDKRFSTQHFRPNLQPIYHVSDPPTRDELGARVEAAVRHQREDNPLHIGRELTLAQQSADLLCDAQALPENIEDVRATEQAAPDHRQFVVALPGASLVETLEAPSEAAQGVRIDPVGATEVVDDMDLGVTAGVADVVGELQVLDDRTVLVHPPRRPKVHTYEV